MNRKLLVVMLLCFELMVEAQTTSIRGTVVDPSKALIPGVTVQMENLETGETKTTFTGEVGRFSFLGVTPGKIRITASLPGFQTLRREVQVGLAGLEMSMTLNLASVTVSLRYKLPEASQSILLEVPASNSGTLFENASRDFRFASSVAAFGMLLRDSPHRGTAMIEDILKIASDTSGADSARTEFVGLARKAATKLRKKQALQFGDVL